ncbi:MAG TPA: sensor domain-containing diguanylate cyclase [Candidatus Krumholzibacteria bacterium]
MTKKTKLHAAAENEVRVAEPLRVSELRYRRLFETAQDGILILDANTGQITDANPFLEALLGYPHHELLGKTLWEIGPFQDIAASQESFRRLQATEYARYDDLPLETRTHERRHVEFVSNAYMVNDVKVIQCNIRDITSRRLADDRAEKVNEDLRLLVAGLRTREEILLEQATRDPLTGLFNRRYLDETLSRELSLCWRRNAILSLVILDIDHFKNINDTFGHEAGDLALRGCAHVLCNNLRKSDIACRLGGEEFVLVLPDSSLEHTRQRVMEIRALVGEMALRHKGRLLDRMTLSAGIAGAPEHAFTARDLLRAADDALYIAKHEGRNQIVLCRSRNGSPGEDAAHAAED